MQTQTAPETAADFYSPRTVILTLEIKGKSVEFTHRTERLEDSMWLEMCDDLNPRQIYDGKATSYADDSEKANRAAYKKLVKQIPSGYQPFFRQTLTEENFYDLIPYADQAQVVAQAFACEIIESESGEFFFDESADNDFDVDAPNGGDTLSGKISLRSKTKADEKAYKEASKIKPGQVKQFRKVEISLKADYQKLSELFLSVVSGVSNFADDLVPVWVRVNLMNHYFTVFAEREIKN